MLESIETSRSSSSMASAITRARVTRRVRVPSRMCCERLMPPFARARWRAWPRLDSNVIDDGGINRCRAVRGDGVADQSAERAELDRRTWFREGVVGGDCTAQLRTGRRHRLTYPATRRGDGPSRAGHAAGGPRLHRQPGHLHRRLGRYRHAVQNRTTTRHSARVSASEPGTAARSSEGDRRAHADPNSTHGNPLSGCVKICTTLAFRTGPRS